jgi:ABC-type antimicrobial peptide transport system permease subunit
VGLLSFTRYAIGSTLRNRRRSLFAVVGIVIALSLVSGSWIAVDSSGTGMLRAALRDYRVDFVATPNGNVPLSEMTDAGTAANVSLIESVEDVTGAMPYIQAYGWNCGNSSSNETFIDPYAGSYGYLLFLPEDNQMFFDAFAITGDAPDPGTVAISKFVADDLDISLGGSVTLSYAIRSGYYDNITYEWFENITYVNLSYEVSQIWTQDPSAQTPYFFEYYQIPDHFEYVKLRDTMNPVVFNLDDLPEFMGAAAPLGIVPSPSITYYIWIDRNVVISIGDLGGSIDNLGFIEGQISKKLFQVGFSVWQSDLVAPLGSLAPDLEGMKLLFLGLSAPLIGLGMYLSIVGVDLGVTERRREVGILKSRGASNSQVFLELLLEATLLGAFAGALGLLLGFGISRPLVDTATSFAQYSSGGSIGTDFRISQSTMAASVLLGIGLMLLSSYRPFKRISKADVAETLHHYSPMMTQVEYKVKWDVLFLGLSGLSIASVLFGLEDTLNIGGSWIVQIIVAILVLAGITLFPLMPFLLSLGIIRPLTRGTRRLYSKFTVIVKPWTKDLHYLVDRNIVRNPRRASNLCVIISLAIAFGLFISITMESNIALQKDGVRAEVGADVKVEANFWSYMSEAELDMDKLDALDTVEGVKSISRFETVSCDISLYSGSRYATVALIDPDEYAETVDPGDFYFVDGGSEKLDELKANGTVLVEESWHDENDVLEGDVLAMRVYWSYYEGDDWVSHEADISVLVVGIVKPLPGLSDRSIFMARGSMGFLSDETLAKANYVVGAFIEVEEGYDQQEVAAEAVTVYRSAGFSATSKTAVGQLEMLRADPAYGAVFDFLYMEYFLSATIMTVGVGLLIFVAVADREKELASIMARGSSGNQIRKILMGESITLMVIGLVIGISVGVLTAYLFNTLYTTGMYSDVERRMVFSTVSGGVVLASVVALLLASVVATARAGKIKLAEVLRIRGG